MKARYVLISLGIIFIVLIGALASQVRRLFENIPAPAKPRVAATLANTTHATPGNNVVVNQASNAPQPVAHVSNSASAPLPQPAPAPAPKPQPPARKPSPSYHVNSANDAVNLVRAMYSYKLQMIPHSAVVFAGTDTDEQTGKRIYVLHVIESFPDHDATIAWIAVRSDMMVRDNLLQNGWYTPSQFPVN